MRRSLLLLGATLWCCAPVTSSAQDEMGTTTEVAEEQPPSAIEPVEEDRRGGVELGVLGGVTLFLGEDQVQWTRHLPNGSAGVYAPITPSVRLSLWSNASFLLDLGFGYYASSVFSGDFSAVVFEVGPGVKSGGKTVVFSASGLLGSVTWTRELRTTNFYVGGQGAMRVFFTDHSAVRAQLGYRHTLRGLPRGFDIDAIEVSLGIGVLL